MSDLWIQIGTLSHNRSFTSVDFRDYTGRSSSELSRLVGRGLLKKVSGGYYPTKAGWTKIEQAYGVEENPVRAHGGKMARRRRRNTATPVRPRGKAAKAYAAALKRQRREPERKIYWHRGFPIEKVPGGGYFTTVFLVDLYGGIEALSLSEARGVINEAIKDGEFSPTRSMSDPDTRGSRRARENPHRGAKKKFPKWAKWGIGLAAVGGLVYLFWPKTASAAQLPPAAKPQPLPQTTPPAIVPGPGNIQITKGTRMVLLQPLRARYGGDYVNVPAGTIYVEHLDADGTIWFQYNGQLLSSPVEDYSDKV